ncbi:BTAD domain-containing putative transcriptional regulator [Gemmatimonadota bacterium]
MHVLKLLGGATIEGPNGPLGGAIAQRQRMAFLALLATAPTGQVSRDRLLAFLWPDLDAGRARRALSNALYVIKKELGEDSVSTVGDDLRLDKTSVSVDVLEFRKASEEGDLERAVTLYAGPFLDGVYLKDAPEFEKWVDGERGQLEGVYREVLEKLAEGAASAGDMKGAADWYRRLASHNPLNSRTAMALMRALAGSGDRAGALQHAQIHGTLLQEELGVDPDPEVTALAEELRRGAGPTPEGAIPSEARPVGEIGVQLEPAVPEEASPSVSEEHPTTDTDQDPFQAEEPGHTRPSSHPDDSLFALLRLRFQEHKVVQWVVAYLAGAWLILQVVDVLADPWNLSQTLQQGVTIILVFGFFLTLVLVWYHGEKGQQNVTGVELLMIAALMAMAGVMLGLLTPNRPLGSEVAGGPPRGTGAALLAARDRPSVAVLPFDNLSPDSSDAYFAEGMHDEIITQLSKISALSIISRTSVLRYRDSEMVLPDIAAELGVSAVLEGSVWKEGDHVRITAQLIDGATDVHLWADSYVKSLDLTLPALFEAQTEIARNVAEALRAALTPEEESRIAAVPTDSLAAYDLYLRGRRVYLSYTSAGNDEAVLLFKQAITLDADYALAWAGLADAYSQRTYRYGYPREWADSAEVASRRSLAVNDQLAEGWKALGLVFTVRGRLAESMGAYERALELNPSHHEALNNLGMSHYGRGELVDALRILKEAVRVEPTFPTALTNVAGVYLDLGLLDMAGLWFDEALAAGPDDPLALSSRLNLFFAMGDPQGALREAEGYLLQARTGARLQWAAQAAGFARDFPKAEELIAEATALVGQPAVNSLITGGIYLLAGRVEEADPLLDRVLTGTTSRVEGGSELPEDRFYPSMIHAGRGNTQEALAWLERAYEAGFRAAFMVDINPLFDPIRADPRYGLVLGRIREDVAEMRGL